jgi:MFS family permease
MSSVDEERRNKRRRWLFFVLASLVIGTNYYAYDALSAIKNTVQLELGFTDTQYGLIVSFYSFPNTFLLMAVIGGIILDRIGIRKVGFAFTFFCALGVILTAWAASDAFRAGGLGYGFLQSFLPGYSPELKLMVVGRLVFGLGAETSIVVVNKIIAKWFKGKELARAFAFNIAIARIGTLAALLASPVLVEADFGWTLAVWVAAVAMTSGLVAFVVYMLYEKRVEEEKAEKKAEQEGVLDADEKFNFRDITDLLRNRGFIYICLLCVTFYSAVFPFQAFCPDFLLNKFGVSEKMSGFLTGFIIFGTIVFTPLFGWFVDKRGKRASLMIYGSAMLLAVHLILSLTMLTPYVAMFVLGVAFSLVPASMWPSVPLIVDEKKLGTAYGLMTSIQNLGLFAFPILAGAILDAVNPGITAEMVEKGEAFRDYTYTILMFAGLGVAGLVFSLLLRREATRKGGPQLEVPET